MDRKGDGLAWAFVEAGPDVWNVDFRVHGRSGPGASRYVDWSYDDLVLYDIPAILKAVNQSRPNARITWVGHSLGAHAAVAALAADPALPIDSLISIGGGVWLARLEPSPLRWLLKSAVFESWGAHTSVGGYCPAKEVGFGSENESASYVRQLVVNGRKNVWASEGMGFDYLSSMRRIRIPVLSLVSTADVLMCHPVCAREWLSHLGSAQIRHRVVGTRAPDPAGISHMGLVTDLRMRPIWTEMVDWSLTTNQK